MIDYKGWTIWGGPPTMLAAKGGTLLTSPDLEHLKARIDRMAEIEAGS